MPFRIVRDDLSNACADAVVLPSNENLIIEGGAGLRVAQRAGLRDVQAACARIGRCLTAESVATPAFAFPARYLVHTVAPVYSAGRTDRLDELRCAYASALECAAGLGCETLCMPLLGAGTYGWPHEVSLAACDEAVQAFLDEHDMDITLVLYGKRAVIAGLEMYDDIASFIDDTYVAERAYRDSTPFCTKCGFELMPGALFCSRCGAPVPRVPEERNMPATAVGGQLAGGLSGHMPAAGLPHHSAAPARRQQRSLWDRLRSREKHAQRQASQEEVGSLSAADVGTQPLPPEDQLPASGSMPQASLDDLLENLDAGFSDTLLALIDARGLTDAQVYKRANMSRQHFSKIRKDPQYRPKKHTAIALAIALELDLDETRDLIGRAGYALTHSSKFDIIIEYHIRHGIYNTFDINAALYSFDQQLLG